MFQDGPKDDNADAGDAPSRSKRGQLGEEETKGSQPGGGDADNDGTYQPPTPAFPSDVLDDGEDASRPLLGNSINSTMSVRDRRAAAKRKAEEDRRKAKEEAAKAGRALLAAKKKEKAEAKKRKKKAAKGEDGGAQSGPAATPDEAAELLSSV